MRSARPRHAFLLAAGLLGLSGCSLAPAVQDQSVVENIPDKFSTQVNADSVADSASTSASPTGWWLEFNDNDLTALVDSALNANYDLVAAAARVKELQERYRIARAPLFPTVTAGANVSDSRTPANSGATGSIGASIPNFPDRFETTTYSASLGLSYELDFWGRLRGAKRSAVDEYLAAASDLETVRIAIISETISTYYEILELHDLVAITVEDVDLLRERVELSEDRYRRGLLSSFELYSIRQSYDNARTNLPLLESTLADARGRMAIVLGTFEPALPSLDGDILQTNPKPVPGGLPSELLRSRPDVVSSALRLEAARQRIGVARADQFPRLSLTSSIGTQGSDLSSLVEVSSQWFSSITGNILAPLFNAGSIRANVRASHAQYEQLAADYAKTVLVAFKDVDTALISLEKQHERYALLQDELAEASSSVDEQYQRIVQGVGDYLAYLDARRNLLRVQSSIVSAQRARIGARLLLHRALGGAWVEPAQLL